MPTYRELSTETIFGGLNEQQRAAVDTLNGPLLVLAGAGTGKTTVITRRILNLLRVGVPAEHILAVTFTKKAALEMRTRVDRLLERPATGMVISTFHALGYRILRTSFNGQPQLIDAPSQLALVRRILEEMRLPRPIATARALTEISRAKNAGLSAEKLRQTADQRSQVIAEVIDRYGREMRRRMLIDFDDLVGLANESLENSTALRTALRRRFRYLLVDEYQDTNRGQYALMHHLISEKQNVCVVGDDDQSIYRFRGADVENILGFSRDFPSACVVRLETNYRSTPEVVALANAVIERGPKRYPKRLISVVRESQPVRVHEFGREKEEDRAIVDGIAELKRQGAAYDDIAVLQRSRADSLARVEALTRARIPVSAPLADSMEAGVSVLTLHSAKGLEFPYVFMPNLEDGTLPHQNAIDDGSEALAEERRLLYVGITRAKRGLVLTASRRRREIRRSLSRFVAELSGQGVFVNR